MNTHIPIKCSTCKYYAIGMTDGENSLDKEAIKTAICTKHKTYDVVCPRACRKSGCKDYHLNWDIYNKLNQGKLAITALS